MTHYPLAPEHPPIAALRVTSGIALTGRRSIPTRTIVCSGGSSRLAAVRCSDAGVSGIDCWSSGSAPALIRYARQTEPKKGNPQHQPFMSHTLNRFGTPATVRYRVTLRWMSWCDGPNWMNFAAAVLFFATALCAYLCTPRDLGLAIVWFIMGCTCVKEYLRRRRPASGQ